MERHNETRRLFQPKSQEQLQAQVENFGDKGVKNFSDDQELLLKYSAELASVRDLDNPPEDLPEDLKKFIRKHKDEYRSFLKKEDRDKRDFIEQNILLYKENFQPAIRALKERMKQGNMKQLPEYLGSGSNGSAFRIEVNGKQYAAKFSNYITQSNFEIKPLIRAKDVPHVAHLVCYSFEDGAVIMELLPGKDVTKFTEEDAPEYSDADLRQFIDTLVELDCNGLVTDPKASNFMYDEKEGFSILDYHLKTNGSRSLSEQVMDARGALIACNFPDLDYKAADYEEQAALQDLQIKKVMYPMMLRYLTLLKETHPELIDDWNKKYKESRRSAIIGSYYTSPDHPELAVYAEALRKLGVEGLFEESKK